MYGLLRGFFATSAFGGKNNRTAFDRWLAVPVSWIGGLVASSCARWCAPSFDGFGQYSRSICS